MQEIMKTQPVINSQHIPTHLSKLIICTCKRKSFLAGVLRMKFKKYSNPCENFLSMSKIPFPKLIIPIGSVILGRAKVVDPSFLLGIEYVFGCHSRNPNQKPILEF